MEYAIQLMKRMIKMLERNEKQKGLYDKIEKRFEGVSWFDNRDLWYDIYRSLSQDEKQIKDKGPYIYLKSDFKRVRVELSKVLLELEKGEQE